MSVDIATYVHDLAVAAKAASASLATASDEQRQEAVRAMAAALRNGVDSIVAANELDMSAARDAGTSAGLLDRLLLTPERVEGMAAGLEKLAELPDPVGRVLDHRVLASGVDLTRVSVPLGLVAMVYEARPNVTADAAGICIRTGHHCAEPLHYYLGINASCRASFYFYNTEDEVDYFLEKLKDVRKVMGYDD